MPSTTRPDWEAVLSAASRLQDIISDAVLVGGTASAVHVRHRLSTDADHVLVDLRERFDEILAQLESVAGWNTARLRRPVQILGSLDGIETGVRQLIRAAPLETVQMEVDGYKLTVPTKPEILRIKAVLIVKRNATRDYVDFAALADSLGVAGTASALEPFDSLYPQSSGESALQQLQIQLSNPLPFDLDENNLAEYAQLVSRWHDWSQVKDVCASCAVAIFDELLHQEPPNLDIQDNAAVPILSDDVPTSIQKRGGAPRHRGM